MADATERALLNLRQVADGSVPQKIQGGPLIFLRVPGSSKESRVGSSDLARPFHKITFARLMIWQDHFRKIEVSHEGLPEYITQD